MSPPSIDLADGLPLPRRYWAILTIALGLVLAVMDGAIANIALPTIARDLNASPAFSIWIVNGYQLAITISLLPLASLGEIVGYRRVYVSGLLLFTVASLACTLSSGLLMLTVSRIVQGFGAAGIMSVNMALVRFIYPRAQLGHGIGLNAMVVATSAAVGPSVAAAILAVATWPYLFAVNLPIGLAALALGLCFLPHAPRASHMFDWQSAALSAVTFGCGIAAIDSLGHGGAVLTCLAEFGVALGAGVLLVYRQTHMVSPLLPVDLLRIPVFALSIATSIASFCAQMLAGVSIPFYLQSRYGYSAVEMGLLITPWPITVAIAAPLAGRLVERYPAGLLGGIGLLLFCGRPGQPRRTPGTSLSHRRCLAHGAVGPGVRPVPDSEQSHHDCGGAARTLRRCERHARHGAAARPDHRCGTCRTFPRPLPGRRNPNLPFDGRCLRAVRRRAQRAPPVGSRPPRRGARAGA